MGIARGNWEDLPIEILDEMLTELPDIEDLIRFGAVCRSWRSASEESKKTKKSCGPWMMLSEPEPRENFLDDETNMMITMFDEEENSNKDVTCNEDRDVQRKFFNVSSKKIIEINLPEAKGRRCFGSKFGWVLTIGLDLNLNLLNPLTRLQIPLPPQPTFETQFPHPAPPQFRSKTEYLRTIYIEKFVMSSHPKDEGCVIMVSYSPYRRLAIARPSDKAWTDVKCPEGWYDDVIFFDNLFYAVQDVGALVVCDITTPVPVATVFIGRPLRTTQPRKYYLVEIAGNLHVVARLYKTVDKSYGGYAFTVAFRIYKLDISRKKWIVLTDLGDHALFIGNNGSFALNHPELRSNCIYFTDDHFDYLNEGNRDMGLFDFGEKKMLGTVYGGDCVCSTFCPPLFFIPNLY